MYRLHDQSGFLDQTDHVVAVVHFAVSIRHRGEIKASHREAERRCFEALTVPQGLHDIQAAIAIHNLGGATQDTHYLILAKAIQELAHPDDVVMLIGRKTFRSIQQIHGITIDAVGARLACGGLSHHPKLLR